MNPTNSRPLSLFQFTSYLRHWLNAVDEHSIHSPYFFDLYTNVIKHDKHLTVSAEIEQLRTKLLQDHTVISIQSLDKSSALPLEKRTISSFAVTSLVPTSVAQLLYRLAIHAKAERIVELETSLGINALYLSKLEKANIHTFESDPALANIALTNFELFDAKNIVLIEGKIESKLSEFVARNRKIDFVVMNVNQPYKSILKCYNELVKRMSSQSILLFDGIYHSKERTKAWKEIRDHELVQGSMDLFRCGLLFFDYSLSKQHYTCMW